MDELKQRVKTEGQDLGQGILKVDGFINHRIDAGLMQRAGAELARRFSSTKPDLVLTAEISGIAPALAAAVALEVPAVYARKTKPITMSEPVFVETAPSHTKGVEVLLMVSPGIPSRRRTRVDHRRLSGDGAHDRSARSTGESGERDPRGDRRSCRKTLRRRPRRARAAGRAGRNVGHDHRHGRGNSRGIRRVTPDRVPQREDLLCSTEVESYVQQAVYVCICRAVSKRKVLAVIADGARTVRDVGAVCGAGTDCGSCRGCIDDLIEEHLEEATQGSQQVLPVAAE
ncbi:MAG: (2Fe-2S)-binding protein [Polyangiaceae bacterium]